MNFKSVKLKTKKSLLTYAVLASVLAGGFGLGVSRAEAAEETPVFKYKVDDGEEQTWDGQSNLILFGKGGVSDNGITLEVWGEGATSYHNIFGCYDSVTINGKTIIFNSGKVSDIRGGVSTSGDVSDNIVNINGGEVSDKVVGGNVLSGNGIANNNVVNIDHGNVNMVFGGESSSGTANDNSVKIINGSVGYVRAGKSTSGTVSGNRVEISGGTVSGTVYGGYSKSGTVSGNRVEISGGTFTGDFIYGGQSDSGTVSGNRVEISGGMVGSKEKPQQIYGGSSPSGNITVDTDKVIKISGNIVEISGGTVSGYVYGGSSPSGNITIDTKKVIEISGNIVEISGNIVEISGGAVTGNIYGGYGDITVDIDKVIKISGNIVEISGNIVEISGGTVNGNIYGGESVNGDATGNSVTINGGIFNGASLYGGVAGEGKISSGNTLNVNTAINGNFSNVSGFQVMNFRAPAYYANSQDQSEVYQMLNVTAAGATLFDFSDVDIEVTNAPYLAAGDYITLIRGVNGTTFSLKDNIHYQVLQFPNYVELVYANGTPMPGTDYIVIQKDGNVLKQYYSDYGGNTYDSVVGNMNIDGLNTASYSNNEVVINKGTYTQSISGASASDDTAVTDNKVSVYGGTISGAVYGGQSTSGAVKCNIVEINGGTISGGVYGGQSSSGDAKYNRVEINSGTVSGAVYGGNSTSGAVSGNKVEISGGVFNGASLYGGVVGEGKTSSSKTSSSNTLFLNTAVNGTVNTVDNFQNIHFTVPSGLASGTPMLSVSTAMSLAGVVLVTDTGALSLSDGQTITLIKGVSDTDFVPNVHYTVDKGKLIYTHIDETKDEVHDYTIRQWDKEYNSGNAGTYSDVRTEHYTGLLIQGNTTDGGLSNTRYSGNEVIIRKGTYEGKVNGAYYDTGTFDITNNKVSVYGGTVTDRVCGGLSFYGTGDFSGNIVNIFDGTIGDVCGFYANDGTGDASDNVVNISGGEVKADVFGAWIMYGTAHNNMVKVTGGTVGRIYGGSGIHAGGVVVTDNLVIISDGTVSGNIYGGWEEYGKISGNRVEISGGKVSGKFIRGGESSFGNVSGNRVEISGGTVSGNFIRGGESGSGTVSSNIVEISGGMVGSTEKSQQIYGGQSTSGTVSGNTVKISDGTVSGTVYGGYSNSGTVSGNTVKVSGGNLIDATLYGWGGTISESHSNNVLQIENPVAVKGIGNFDSINLVLPENVADNTKILTMSNAVDLTGVAVNVYLNGQEPDTITLIDKVENSGTYNIWVGTDNSAELRDNYTISVDNGSLLLKANVVLWYMVGDEKHKFSSSTAAQPISDTSGKAVVLYRGAGDNNEYKDINITGALTVGAETETGKSFLVSGDLTAGKGVTVATKNTLNVAASNLKSAVTNNGTVNLGEGTLAQNITGTTGTTTLTGDVNFISGNKIEGTLNGNGKNVTLGSGTDAINTIDTFTVGTLTGTLNLNLDVDMSNFTSDKIETTTFSGSVVVNNINVTKEIENNPLELSKEENNKITYLTKTTGDGTTAVNNDSITVTNNYKYTFTGGSVGKLNYKVEAVALTFKKFMEGNLSGNITTLSLTENLLNSGDGSTAINQAPATVNINLNGHELSSAEESVVTVTTDKTLNINGGSDAQNAGVVDANTDFTVAGTLAVSGNTDIKGDVTNTGTVTFAGTAVAEGSLSGEGTYINTGILTVADASNLQMTKAFKNTSILELQGGNLEAEITDITSAAGTTIISGTVTNTGGKEIFQKNLNIASGGNFTTSADTIYSVEVINDDGNLSLTGGKLERPVQGTGNITFSGDVTTIADNIATTGINTVETGKKLILDGGTLTQKVQGPGNLNFTGDVTTNAENVATTGINEVATGVTLTFIGGTVGGDISGAGKVEIAGNVTSAKNISNFVTVDSGATYTITSGTQSNTVANSGTFNVQGGTVQNYTVNNTTGSTMNVSGGTVTSDIIVASGAVLNISGGEVQHFDNKGTVNVSNLSALSGHRLYNTDGVINFDADGTLKTDNTIEYGTLNVNANVTANIGDMTAVTTNIATNKSLTLTGSGTLSTTLAGEGNVVFNDNVSTDVQHLGNTGKHFVASGKILTINAGTFDENFVTEGTVTLAGEAVYQTTAGKVFTEGDATVKTGVGAVRTDEGSTANLLKLVSGTIKLTDAVYSLEYLVSATDVLSQFKYDDINFSTTKLIMMGTMKECKGGTVPIDIIGNLPSDVVLDKVVVDAGENPTIEKGFTVKGLKLAEGSTSVTIASDTPVTLGGTEGGTLIKVGESDNTPVNVAVGNTEKSATLNIGNGVMEVKEPYSLTGNITANKNSVVNINDKTNITGNVNLNGTSTMKVKRDTNIVKGDINITGTLNMAGGEVAVASGAQLTVPTINVTDDAQMSGKIITENLISTEDKIITVGNADDDFASHVSATTIQLNGGMIFLDPVWKDGIKGASHVATQTTDLDGAYVVGQNSVLTFGATNEEADIQFKTSGLKWGESNITAAAYVAKNLNVTNGSLTVDGHLTTDNLATELSTTPTAGTVNLAANSLLMVQGEKITSTAAISGVKSAYVANTAHVFIQGAKPETTYLILAGIGIESALTADKVALPGTIKDATVVLDENKKYLNITTGELKFSTQNIVIPNVGEELVQSGNEQFAQMIDTLPEQQTANVNAYANLGENLGVSRGAYDVANMVGDAIDNHWDTHHEAKDVWAAGTRNKETLDGVELGGMEAQYNAQYNGAVVGVNLSGNFGMAINYTDGKVNNRLGGHNDAEYYGGSMYVKTDWGNLRISLDGTYTYGKNELSQNGITADAKTETISGGLTLKYLAKAGFNQIGPFAGIRYIHIEGRDYTDNFGVNREAEQINSMVVPVGLEYTGEFEMPGSAWTWRPVLMAGYLFNFGDRSGKMFMRYNEAMDTFGYDLVDEGAFFAKAGMTFSKKNFSLGISYDIMRSKHSQFDRWNVNMDVAF